LDRSKKVLLKCIVTARTRAGGSREDVVDGTTQRFEAFATAWDEGAFDVEQGLRMLAVPEPAHIWAVTVVCFILLFGRCDCRVFMFAARKLRMF
jgi:hypothetical protein